MDQGNPPQSFQDYIHNERKKKKNEDLASRLLGGRRKTQLPPAVPKRIGTPLSSRVGITKVRARVLRSRARAIADHEKKRSSSATPDGSWLHDLYSDQETKSAVPRAKRTNRTRDLFERTVSEDGYNGRSQFTIRSQQPPSELKVKGLAYGGPYVVIASNFAEGTTAADIKTSMESVGGEIQSCHLVASRPTVIAEVVFTEKSGAEQVIEVFNNAKADGRLLYVYMKQGGPSPRAAKPHSGVEIQEPPRNTHSAPPQEMIDVDMDVDDHTTRPRASNWSRPRSPMRYASLQNRGPANLSHQDGSYGFDNPTERQPTHDRDYGGVGSNRGRDPPTGPRRQVPLYRPRGRFPR